jgi:hypothetical protein
MRRLPASFSMPPYQCDNHISGRGQKVHRADNPLFFDQLFGSRENFPFGVQGDRFERLLSRDYDLLMR